jgi:hypothetical protein
MLRAMKTAVQALIAEISPWILFPTINKPPPKKHKLKHRGGEIRWIPSSEIRALADNFICCVIDNDGTE